MYVGLVCVCVRMSLVGCRFKSRDSKSKDKERPEHSKCLFLCIPPVSENMPPPISRSWLADSQLRQLYTHHDGETRHGDGKTRHGNTEVLTTLLRDVADCKQTTPSEWVSTKIHVAPSSRGGQGVFALEPLKRGETLCVCAPFVHTEAVDADYVRGIVTALLALEQPAFDNAIDTLQYLTPTESGEGDGKRDSEGDGKGDSGGDGKGDSEGDGKGDAIIDAQRRSWETRTNRLSFDRLKAIIVCNCMHCVSPGDVRQSPCQSLPCPSSSLPCPAAFEYTAMFDFPSRFNHNCDHSVGRVCVGEVSIFSCLRDIAAGEEMSISYFPIEVIRDGTSRPDIHINTTHTVPCNCSMHNQRLKDMQTAQRDMETAHGGMETADEVVDIVRQLAQQPTREHLYLAVMQLRNGDGKRGDGKEGDGKGGDGLGKERLIQPLDVICDLLSQRSFSLEAKVDILDSLRVLYGESFSKHVALLISLVCCELLGDFRLRNLVTPILRDLLEDHELERLRGAAHMTETAGDMNETDESVFIFLEDCILGMTAIDPVELKEHIEILTAWLVDAHSTMFGGGAEFCKFRKPHLNL